jgi:hypothetical protein
LVTKLLFTEPTCRFPLSLLCASPLVITSCVQLPRLAPPTACKVRLVLLLLLLLILLLVLLLQLLVLRLVLLLLGCCRETWQQMRDKQQQASRQNLTRVQIWG